MGINSTEVAYNFGQLGSAYSDIAQTIIPPKDHVIVAIQFLEQNTPTVLTPEQLDTAGPNFPFIKGDSNVDSVGGARTFNNSGVVSVALTDNAGSDILTVAMSAGANSKVKAGQFVLLAKADMETDGDPDLEIDSQTPIPIYNGPNAQGVKIEKVDGANVTLVGHGTTADSFAGISPSSQMLVCLDEYHGAGGIQADGQQYPAGLTIYGRWTAFKPSAAGVICYFGK